MAQALAEAEAAARAGEVPVGAVLVDAKGTVIAAAGNRTRTDNDPTAHAEMVVIRAAAAKLGATKQALLDACDATARGTRSVRRHALAMAAATATYQRLFLLLWSRTTPPHAPTYLPRYRATQRWQRSKG